VDPGDSARAVEVTEIMFIVLLSRCLEPPLLHAPSESRGTVASQVAPTADMFNAGMTKIKCEAKIIEKEKGSPHGKHQTLTAKIPNDLVKLAIHVRSYAALQTPCLRSDALVFCLHSAP
jgi:hypothetical protein